MHPSARVGELLLQQCYVDGKWVNANNGETVPVHNPSTCQPLGTVPRFGETETRAAIEAAERAWPAWRARSAKERSDLLRRWFDACMTARDELAAILTLEQGKPLPEAMGEIAYGASFIAWFAEESRRIYRERRGVLCGGLRAAGFEVLEPKATFYVLVACPRGYSSIEFASRLLVEAGVVATPATGFGACGEGFVRLTLCADKARMAEAAERVKNVAL